MALRLPLSRQRGVALLFILLVLGLGASLLVMRAYKPGGERLREQQTLVKLAAAREALIGYATQNGRLPRPARSATDGVESALPCTSAQSCSGFIPWVTLGIDGIDSWGKLIRYSVTPSFTVVPLQPTTSGGDKIILGRDGRGQPVYLVGQEQCPLYAGCSPAVIYSSGKNAPGTSIQGIRLASATATNFDERENDVASTRFMRRPLGTDPDLAGGEFDDLVTWLPVQQLYSRMRAAQVLK